MRTVGVWLVYIGFVLSQPWLVPFLGRRLRKNGCHTWYAPEPGVIARSGSIAAESPVRIASFSSFAVSKFHAAEMGTYRHGC